MLTLTGLSPATAVAGQARVATLQFGTVAWALDTMAHHRLAARAGVDLTVAGLASTQATKVALQAGDADVIAADWIWVARQRADGKDLTFLPFSAAVGALVTPATSQIRAIADLPGRKLGIAGGPLDKSWLLLRAVAARQHGLELEKVLEPAFGAPPLLNQMLRQDRIDGVLTYWHYAARLTADGHRAAIDVRDLYEALGIPGPLPIIGFVFKESWARDNPETVAGFARAVDAALAKLRDDDDEWLRLRPRLRAKSDDEARQLRDGFRAGIDLAPPEVWQAGAARLFAVLADIGGAKLVGPATSLPEGTFWRKPE